MLAGIYLTLKAQFIAVLQILVYAGAIMVLVIFVIMLLNLGKEHELKEESSIRKYAGVAFGGVLAAQVALLIVLSTNTFEGLKSKAAEISTIEALGKVLYTDFLFQFEAITLLLLVAVMGALILARRRKPHESYTNN